MPAHLVRIAEGVRHLNRVQTEFSLQWHLAGQVDGAEAAHGRAPAVATGVKRVQPDKVVFTYQGDGDLASIGMAEIVWAAARGENITVFFVNDAIYGMPGGQMAPTSLPGQVTNSSPKGRDVKMSGLPVKMAEMLAGLPGAGYVVRRSVHDVKSIRQAQKAIRAAFEVQLAYGKNVTWIPSYGPEMRGGTAHVIVIISNDPIGSPVVRRPQVAMLFNSPSMKKYELDVLPGGVLVYNSSLISHAIQRTDIRYVAAPANDIAAELGNVKMANMVMVGAMIAATQILPLDTALKALKDHLPASKQALVAGNLQALQCGAAPVETVMA